MSSSADRLRTLMNRRPWLLPTGLALIVCAGAAGVLAQQNTGASKAGSADANAKPAAAARPALVVTAEKPRAENWGQTVAGNGNVAAWQEAVIGAEVNGLRLAELRANVGDVVKRGQLLARFAAETLDADLAQQRAAVAEAEASLSEAKANADRARKLQETGSLSGQEISQYLTAERTGEARLASAQARLDSLRITRRHADVVAPDDGVISQRSATVGSVVVAGTELFRLIRRNRLEWRGEFIASELARIEPGQKVSIGATGVGAAGSSATDATAPIEGRVRVVGPTVDTTNRTALVYVDLPAGTPLKPGMFARGAITLGSARALTVPQAAVVVRDGKAYVYRLGADGRVAQTAVVTGRRQGDRVEIASGLAADVQVVVRGAGFLIDGDLVALQAAEPAASKPAGTPANTTARVAS